MRFIKNLGIYAGIDILGALIGLVTSPITTRLLTEKQYGTIPLIASVWAIVMILRFGGMNWSYLFFRVREGVDQRTVLITATITATLSSIITVAGFSVVAIFTPLIKNFVEISQLEICLYLAGLMPAALVDWYLYLLRFMHQAKVFARIAVLQRIVSIVIAIPFMFMAPQSMRLAVIVGTISGVSFIALFWTLFELHRIGKWPYARKAFSRPMMEEMLKYGLYMVPGGVAYAFVTVTDRLLVGGIKGTAEVAILALATSLGMMVIKMKKWIELTFNPHLIEWLSEDHPEIYETKLNKTILMLTLAFMPLTALMAVWAGPVVTFLYPAAYIRVGQLVPVIALSGTLSVFTMVAIATLIIRPNKALPLIINCAALVANVAIGLLLIPSLGALGAVIGTAAAESLILLGWIVCGSRLFRNLALNWGPALWGSISVAGVILFCHIWLPASGMPMHRIGITALLVLSIMAILSFYPPARQLKKEVLILINS